MTEEAKQALKQEAEDDLDGPISSLSHKSLKKKESIPKDELDDDDAPLAFSKARKNKPSNPSKMKKEEPEDGEDEKPLKKKEGLKKRPSNSPNVKKEKFEEDEDEKPLKKKEILKKTCKPNSVKKEVLVDSEEDEEDEKVAFLIVLPYCILKSKKRKRKEEKRTVVKVKKVVASQKKVKNVKKEKKVYDLPGQKHDPPERRDPLRIFYETLYEKMPTSEMAAIWLMEWGLLPLEEARKVYAKRLRKNHNKSFGSPAKVTPVKKSSTVSVKKNVKVTSKTVVKRTKKKVSDSEEKEEEEDEEDDDDDFIIKKLGNKKKVSSK